MFIDTHTVLVGHFFGEPINTHTVDLLRSTRRLPGTEVE